MTNRKTEKKYIEFALTLQEYKKIKEIANQNGLKPNGYAKFKLFNGLNAAESG